ncbi:MAG: type VI secretion system contractile sheath large subunit [Gemmatimonadales bacterium]|nr:type VI secretion system contractile sheath large subunit [Gemmatimonadales bacterium]
MTTPSKPAKGGATATAAAPPASLLDRIILEGRMTRDASDTLQQAAARRLVEEFAVQVVDKNITPESDTAKMISRRIEKIDELLSAQVNAILHTPAFQALEARWRGLHDFVMGTETSTTLKLRLLNVSQAELKNDLDKAVDVDQSTLFKKVYEEEYGTFGGQPYGLLVGDIEFGRHPEDVGLLKKIAQVAASAHAPFVAAASPRLFDMDDFTELGVPRDLAKIFESSDLADWRSFRKDEDSRYVALALPHVLKRLPYGPDTKPVEGFNFKEDTDGRDHRKYLWGNAAYLLAQRITNAFARYGWCAAIRGVEGGGKVEGLPAHIFRTDDGDKTLKPPTEVAITDRREKELNDLGFIALCHRKGENYAAFFGGATTNDAPEFFNPNASANAQLSSQLPYLLAASRFAHFLKVMMRDKVGSFQSRENVEKYLNAWIANYVLVLDDAPQSTKAQFPLRSARVDVTEVPGRPGAYRATVFLRPHFQLETLNVSIRLVADLPPPLAA